MKHVLSVKVNNTAGVLSHVTGLFTRRSYNIDSLCVGETNDPKYSVITLVIDETPEMIQQITKQVLKLIDREEHSGPQPPHRLRPRFCTCGRGAGPRFPTPFPFPFFSRSGPERRRDSFASPARRSAMVRRASEISAISTVS